MNIKIKRYQPFIKHSLAWIASLLLLKFLQNQPQLIEKVYAEKFYPIIALINRWLMHFFSFSIGDLLYFGGISYFIYQILLLVINYKNPAFQARKISDFLLQTLWIFYLSWGLNYFRQPLAEQLHLSQKKYTAEQLIKVTDTLIKQANSLQYQITNSDSIAVEIPYSFDHILNKTPIGYQKIASYIKVKYRVPCIKPSLFSTQISYMKVSGYLNPFTGEAQVNKLYPKVFLPSIASHEVAHQLGFAPENEANFLGYLAASHHPDLYFKYAATIDALYYFLIELKQYDSDLFKEYLKKINIGILKNYKEAQNFHKRYRFPINFSKTYDAYLKLNQQKSGIKSYNEMVSLVIAYYYRHSKSE